VDKLDRGGTHRVVLGRTRKSLGMVVVLSA